MSTSLRILYCPHVAIRLKMCIKRITTLHVHDQSHQSDVNTANVTTAWTLQYPRQGTSLATSAHWACGCLASTAHTWNPTPSFVKWTNQHVLPNNNAQDSYAVGQSDLLSSRWPSVLRSILLSLCNFSTQAWHGTAILARCNDSLHISWPWPE